MAGFVWDFTAPSGQQLKKTDVYQRERQAESVPPITPRALSPGHIESGVKSPLQIAIEGAPERNRPNLDVGDLINRGVFESAVPTENQGSQGGFLGALKNLGQRVIGRGPSPAPGLSNDAPLIAAMRPGLSLAPGGNVINAMLPTMGNAENPGYREAWGAGVGDVMTSAGGAAKWLGADNAGELISQSGQMLQRQGENLPDDLSHNIVRASPFTLSLIPATMAAAFGGAEIAGAAGLGALGVGVSGAVSGALVSRSLEGMLEAGNTYEEAVYRGMSEDEADQAAKSVYVKNMALTGMDAGELVIALAPIKGFGKIARTIYKTKAGKVAAATGRVAGTAGLEAGEEGIQDVFQRQALGDEIALDDQMKKSMLLGGVMGGGMGAVGAGYHGIKDGLESLGQKKAGTPSVADPAQRWQDIVNAYKVPQGQAAPPPALTQNQAYGPPASASQPIQPVQPVIDTDKGPDTTKPATPMPTGITVGDTVEWTDSKGNVKTGTVENMNMGQVTVVTPEGGKPTLGIKAVRKVEGSPQVMTTTVANTEIAPAGEPVSSSLTEAPKKELWEMTQADFINWSAEKTGLTPDSRGDITALGKRSDIWKRGHKVIVKKALSEGNPVPPEVLADYPDLAGQKEEVALSPQNKLQPDIVFREIRDFDGKVIGIETEKYDGSKEGARKAAEAIESRLDEKYPDWSNINSRIGATDETGNPKYTVSPNLQNVKDVQRETDEARYIWGDIEALGAKTPSEATTAPIAGDSASTGTTAPAGEENAPQTVHGEAVQEGQGSPLEHYGLSINKGTTKNGKTVWEVTGNTKEHKDALGKAGGRWYGPKKSWSYYGDSDPTERILSKLPQLEKKTEEPARAESAQKEEKPQVDTTKTEGTVVESKQEKSPSREIAGFVQERLEKKEKITSDQLFRAAEEAYGGTQAEGKFTPKDAYDAMELGVNQFLLDQLVINPTVSAEQAQKQVKALTEMLSMLPTQTKRTAEQEEFQQFSTPPNIAYTAAWAATIKPEDIALEPSAGIGGLAVFGKLAGAEVIVNELSPRRAALLTELDFDQVFTENAEQLHNILPDDVKPTVVIMNPPFSSTAGRMQGARKTKFAEAHLEQALKRLEPGGRLVAIVGRGMADDASTFRDWWKGIKKEYNVRANIGIDGKNYAKYGTTFDVQVLVIDKTGATPEGGTVTGSVTKLEDAISLLEVVRNDRAIKTDKPVKQKASESNSKDISEEGQAEAGPKPAVSPSTGGVGTIQREGDSGGQKGNIGGPAGTGEKPVTAGQPGGDNEPADQGGARSGSARGDVDKSEGTGKAKDPGGRGGIPSGQDKGGSGGERGGAVSAAEESRSGDNDSGGTKRSLGLDSEISIEAGEAKHGGEELSDAVFAAYTPQRLKIPGAKEHPGNLAQSAAMAAVEPPVPTYTPNLPKELITKGKLSIAQLESVVYAGQAHEQVLPNGQRRGFFIGDGTGVGKGREISGIILDNFRQGRKKAVWISKNDPLLDDARRDFGDLGGDSKAIFGKPKTGEAIKQKEGVLFMSYDTLGQGLEMTREGEAINREGSTSRIDQIVNWLGKDFDGVIAFDEAHGMQNSLAQKGKRGVKKPSRRALAGVELQKKLPNARIVYVSATGATEVHNLAYADRLGLWGEGTSFADKKDFINKISAGGLAAMELVARDMKAMGVYIARNLGFEGVTYSTMEHNLTPEQTEIYDTMAKGWQVVLQNIYKAMEETGQAQNGNDKGRALAKFWGAQQRFFNQVLTSMQMPSVISQVKEDIKNGKAVVMQLVNTNEAIQNRAIARQEEGESLEDIDLTPRDMLMQYLDKSFPTQQYETYTDDDGNERSRPVYDSRGNPVQNREALAMKDTLMSRLGAMKVPEGPLELVLNTFGIDNVAEVTGRTRRIVRVKDEETGRAKSKLENRTVRHVAADAAAFMEDKKRILVFSEAGGTGRSYHADLTKKNQRQRVHYLIQAGWKADSAVQGFGRTHRTNQASAPDYKLVTTDLKGQKRFISSIARRLDQLGALTKGQRQTGGQGLFSAKDNLESDMSRDALLRFYEDLTRNQMPDINGKEVLEKMGLAKLTDDNVNLKETPEGRDITKFLNRLLSLESDLQNKVFDAFSQRLDIMVDMAIANGTLDMGLENFRADKVKITEEKTVYTDEKSGAETKYIALEAGYKNHPFTFDKAQKLRNFRGFYQNKRSGRVYAVRHKGTTTLENGRVVDVFSLFGQAEANVNTATSEQFNKDKYTELSLAEARELWQAAVDKLPEYRTEKVHLISGAILPIWDRLPQERVRVIRVLTDDGRMLLGRQIGERAIDLTLKRLGAERQRQDINPVQIADSILKDNYTVFLANEWRLVRRRVSGEDRIEIIGNDLYHHIDQLQKEGVFTERINWNTRFFIPTGEKAVQVIGNVTKYRPVVDMEAPAKGTGGGDSGGGSSLDEVREAMNRKIDDEIGDVNPPAGFSIKLVGKPPAQNANQGTENYSFEDSEIEERFQAANGMPEESFFVRVKESFRTLYNKAHREYEHLPRNAEFAELRKDLLKLAKQRGVAGDKTLRLQQGITINLDPYKFDVFRRYAILADLMEEAEAGHALPFGFTEESLEAEWDRINNEADKHPEIREAIEDRQKIWKAIVKEYTGNMRSIGFNVDRKFTKESYYRHQVIEYAKLKGRAMSGTGQKLKTPTGRGFLKQRGGSEMDINTNYLQAEYEVMAQMLYDIEVARTIKAVDENYNIHKRLKQEAKAANKRALERIIEKQDKMAALVEAELKSFNIKMGMSFGRLRKHAETGELWTGNNGEYQDIVDQLKDGHRSDLSDERGRLFRYLSDLLVREDAGSMEAATILKAVSNRANFTKETLGRDFKTWENMIPDGYVAWQPREGNIFFMSETIPGHLAEKLFTDQVEQLGISKEDLNRALTIGGRRKEFVVKQEIADTLDNLTKPTPDDLLHKVVSEPLRWWKVWQLLSPRRWFKYNFRNISGDAEAVFIGNPAAFLKVLRSARELYDVFAGDKSMTPNMKDWFERGGMETLLQVQELGEINNLRMFLKLQEKKGSLTKIPIKTWQGYWKAVRLSTDYREALLRYASYLSYLQQMEKSGGQPKNYGASIPEEIMALKDTKDRAFKLSNELLGAYDEISVMGQGLRKYLMPFWSWNEVNFRRTIQLFKNAARDEKLAYAVGRKLVGAVAIRTPYLALKVGKFALMAFAMWTLLTLWNNMLFPDEEKELGEHIKSRPHIIFGRDNDGKILYFDRLGFVQDFLSWFGMDEAPLTIKNLIDGKMTPKEFAVGFVKAPINKLVQSVGPVIKWPVELLSGESYYPDAFKGKQIRDRWEYLASGLGLGNEYKMLSGKPMQTIGGSRAQGYLGSIRDVLTYSADPGQSAYYDILDEKRRYMKKINKLNEGSFNSPKSEALYNFKMAVRYRDREAAKKYLEEYAMLGGTDKGLDQSLKSMHPLYGLNQQDQIEFIKSLSIEDRQKLVRALTFYERIMLGQGKK